MSAAVALVITLAAGACGGSSLDVEQDPRGSLQTAVRNLGTWEGLAATIRVDSDPASLVALAEGDPVMTEDLAQTIVDSRLRVRGAQGDPADRADDEVDVLLEVGDLIGFELRVAQEQLFVRSDVRQLVTRFDTSGEGLTALDEGVAQAKGFGLDFVEQAVEGAWLELEGVEELMSMAQGMAGTAAPSPSDEQLDSVTAELTAAFERFVSEDVAIEYVGSDDTGEHVRLTASGTALLDLVEQLVTAVGSVPGFLGGLDPDLVLGDLREAADSEDAASFSLPLDVWIRGDTVSRVAFDLLAFGQANPELMEGEELPADVERLALVVDLEEFGGGVEAPSDAVPVNLFEIFGQMMGGMGQAFESAA